MEQLEKAMKKAKRDEEQQAHAEFRLLDSWHRYAYTLDEDESKYQTIGEWAVDKIINEYCYETCAELCYRDELEQETSCKRCGWHGARAEAYFTDDDYDEPPFSLDLLCPRCLDNEDEYVLLGYSIDGSYVDCSTLLYYARLGGVPEEIKKYEDAVKAEEERLIEAEKGRREYLASLLQRDSKLPVIKGKHLVFFIDFLSSGKSYGEGWLVIKRGSKAGKEIFREISPYFKDTAEERLREIEEILRHRYKGRFGGLEGIDEFVDKMVDW
jgi:hypothetical protein